MGSSAKVQILNGPVGSGKTTAVMIKLIRLASKQQPSTCDTINLNGEVRKVRKFKVCCVRDTYRQLWKTTLKSWWKRIPKEAGEFVGSEGGPASHRILFAQDDGTVVDFLIEFIAIGENSVEDVLRGYEPTCFYLNEADLLAKEVYTYSRGRAGRYPDMSEGGPTWYGVLMDCNAPELTNWLFQDVFMKRPASVDLYIQPSGLSSEAENVPNLPKGYYEDQIADNDDFYVDRMVKNIAGLTPQSPRQLIGRDIVEPAISREATATIYDPLLMGIDVGRDGDDPSVIRFRRGRDARSIPPIKLHKADTMAVAVRAADEAKRLGVAAIFVDGGGVGGGVVDRLRQLVDIPVFDIQFGAASDRPTEDGTLCANKRTEMHVSMKDWLKHGGAIDNDAALIVDLTAVQYTHVFRDGREAIMLEPKAVVKKLIGRSPDDGDALALTFAYPIAPTTRPQVGTRARQPNVLPDWDPHAMND